MTDIATPGPVTCGHYTDGHDADRCRQCDQMLDPEVCPNCFPQTIGTPEPEVAAAPPVPPVRIDIRYDDRCDKEYETFVQIVRPDGVYEVCTSTFFKSKTDVARMTIQISHLLEALGVDARVHLNDEYCAPYKSRMDK